VTNETKTKTEGALPAPHSWDLEHWPPHVYPHSENRARYLIRAYRDELLKFGAISRIGREIVILGAAYTKWLTSGTKYVPGFTSNANRK
jgi:hypothetical protein